MSSHEQAPIFRSSRSTHACQATSQFVEELGGRRVVGMTAACIDVQPGCLAFTVLFSVFVRQLYRGHYSFYRITTDVRADEIYSKKVSEACDPTRKITVAVRSRGPLCGL